jgi:hypothetical protein
MVRELRGQKLKENRGDAPHLDSDEIDRGLDRA